MLYTNKGKTKNRSGKKNYNSEIQTNATDFEVKYVTNWWQDKNIDCHAMEEDSFKKRLMLFFLENVLNLPKVAVVLDKPNLLFL